MPFAPGYSRTKNFAALGTFLPSDINAIQDDLGGAIEQRAPLAVVTSLPGSPVDGQEVVYQSAAMATDGVTWRLKYRASSASAYKWEFIGGSFLFAQDDPDRVYTSTGAWSSTPTTLQIATPLAGDWEVWTTAAVYAQSVAGSLACGVGIAGVAPAGFAIQAQVYAVALISVNPANHGKITAQPAGTNLRHYVLGPNASDIHPRGRIIGIKPIRVG